MFLGKYFRAYVVGGFSALGGFLFGYHTGVISGVLVVNDFQNMTYDYRCLGNSTISCNEGLSTYLTGLIVGILLLGCFIGSLIGGQTSDRFSRKYSICAFSIVFTIAAAVQTGSSALWMILVGRFISGKFRF